MEWNNFEAQYQLYEQSFMREARLEFDKQPANNKVQYLRGVFRYLLLNRILARKGHTVGTVLKSRYIDKKRSADTVAEFVSGWVKKILHSMPSDTFHQMRIDAIRTLYDIFPDETTKGWQFVFSAAEGIDIVDDRKFWLTKTRHNIILEWVVRNNLKVRTRAESQQANAHRMSVLKRKTSPTKDTQ